jgi:hypothetical protein
MWVLFGLHIVTGFHGRKAAVKWKVTTLNLQDPLGEVAGLWTFPPNI